MSALPKECSAQPSGHPGVVQWEMVVAVGAVCFQPVDGRRVVVVCQAHPRCRVVDCVAFVVSDRPRPKRFGQRPLLDVPVCPSRPR